MGLGGDGWSGFNGGWAGEVKGVPGSDGGERGDGGGGEAGGEAEAEGGGLAAAADESRGLGCDVGAGEFERAVGLGVAEDGELGLDELEVGEVFAEFGGVLEFAREVVALVGGEFAVEEGGGVGAEGVAPPEAPAGHARRPFRGVASIRSRNA